MTDERRNGHERPQAEVVRAALAKKLEISETELRFYMMERGIGDEALRFPRWCERLEHYVVQCKRGTAEPQKFAGDFVWRYSKLSINSRGFATNAPLRRAAERIALAAGAALERSSHAAFGPTLGITVDRCSVVLAEVDLNALVVTAFTHDPTPASHFFDVAARVTAIVDLHHRLRGLA